jgi:hypothetical protein
MHVLELKTFRFFFSTGQVKQKQEGRKPFYVLLMQSLHSIRATERDIEW